MKKVAAELKRTVGFLRRRRVVVAFSLLGALHLFIALANTGSEWIYGHQGWAGARRSLNAKNYLRYGYMESRLCPLDNLGAVKTKDGKPAPKKIYWHHPIGLPLIMSAVFAVFGESPVTARLFFTFLSLLSFLMMVLIFRKFLGNWQTFVALIFLSFIPLYAAYLNFVNYEIFVIFCAFCVIFFYESHREKRRWWKVLLIGVAVLFGAFSEYPIFPFFFFFWIVLIVAELKEGWKRWKLPVLFPVFVLAGGALLILSMKFMMEWGWEKTWISFKNMFIHRHSLKTESPHLLVLEKWEYYWRFFNPVVMIFTLYWIFDLTTRAFLRKWRRGDAYVVVLFLMAFAYWYLLPQAAKIHEYVALYFSLPFAFAAAAGLWHLTASISYDSFKARLVLRLFFVAAIIVTSVPFIWSIRVFPTYKLLEPVHEMESPKDYNYLVSYNILGRFVKEKTEPDEKIAFFPDFDIRPEFWYYLDRNHRVIRQRRDMLNVEKKRSYAFIMINRNTVGIDFLAHLLKRHNFAFTDHYYAFDLGNHLRSITFLRKELKEKSAPARYFISLPHPAYTIEEDRWKIVDLTLKLRGRDEAERVKKVIKPPAAGSLSEAVARYNLATAGDKRAGLKDIRSHLGGKGKSVFADVVEYLGSRIERHGGRTYVRFLFRPKEQIDFNFFVKVTARPLHENEELRSEIGEKVRLIRFVIPSLMWKPGYVYVAEDELLFFSGPYDLSFELIQNITYQVMNEASNDNTFTFSCKSLPGDFPGNVESVTSNILGMTSLSPQKPETVKGLIKKMEASRVFIQKDIGSDLGFLGCIVVPYGANKWSARMFFHNVSIDGRHINLTVSAKGSGLKSPYKKAIDLGLMKGTKAPGRIFMVEETLSADPSKLQMTMLLASKGVPSPLRSKKGTKLSIGKGDYGVHLPLQWLYWYGKIR